MSSKDSGSAVRAGEKEDLPAAHDLSASALGFSGATRGGSASSSFALGTRDIHFTDAYGRAVLLHGVNVSSSSKLPAPASSSEGQDRDQGKNKQITFVGRPFPLSEADIHLARLREWGYTTLRLLVTWEALQPSTPQETDASYIAYLHALLQTHLPRHGIRAFVCAHQDVWSRACGGSGAPGWTLEGYQKLAAATMATVFWAGDIFAYKIRVPRSWSPGHKTTSAKQGHNDEHKDGEEMVGLQTFLQDAYLRAFGELADAVGGLESVLGFEVMNEPHRGFVNLHSFDAWDYDTDLHIGFFPSFLQAVALGEGHAQLVPFYVKSFPFPTALSHYSLVEPPPFSTSSSSSNPPLWRPDGPTRGQCLWRMHDVWAWDEGRLQKEFGLWERIAHWGCNLRGYPSIKEAVSGKPVALRADYFEYDPRLLTTEDDGGKATKKSGVGFSRRRIEWYRDCYAPLVSKFADRIRKKQPHLHIFFEPIPNEFVPPWREDAAQTSKEREAMSAEERNEEAEMLEELEHAARLQTYSHANSRNLIDTPRPVGSIFAPHFYDLHVLFNKAAGAMSVNVQGLSRGMFFAQALYFGAKGPKRNYATQISNLIANAHLSLGRGPTLIGEVGIPFDINSHHAFKTGDYRVQSRLMDALIGAMESCWASFTLWNYCAENTTEQGDLWNAEDFSLMTLSGGAQDRLNKRGLAGQELYKHGRALDAVIRPYAVKIAGVPLSTSFQLESLSFNLVWANSSSWPLQSDPGLQVDRTKLTEVFWPRYHYEGRSIEVELSDGEWWIDEEKQSLYILHSDIRPGCKHSISIRVKGMRPATGRSSVDILIVGLVFGVLAVLLYGLDRFVMREALHGKGS
ncbi:unnamed protein product [Tilletia caries]|nr:unnamed protein product [Tilletia caries]